MASIGRPSGKARESLLWRTISEKPETGFEPVTYRLQGGCSGQLSYSGGKRSVGVPKVKNGGPAPINTA